MNFWFCLIVLLACLNTDVFSAPTTKLTGTSRIVTRPVKTKKPPKQPPFDPQKFLLQNGYGVDTDSENVLLKKFAEFTDLFKNEYFKKMIKLYQSLHNLTVTGIIDEITNRTMMAARCGLPELPVKLPLGSLSKPQSKPGTAFGSFKTASRWNKNDLTWSLINFTPDLGEARTRTAITQAFKYWSDVTPLKFKEVCARCTADLKIIFGQYHHGDPYPFDGAGQVLAHAFFPSDGRIHFDDAEYFTEGTSNGINLRIVAAHEIGHALGLDHSDVYEALMAPTYRYSSQFKLHNDDIRGIQSLYRRRPGSSTGSKPNTPGGLEVKSIICTELIDAIFTGANKNEINFIINDDQLWGFNLLTRKFSERKLAEYKLPENVRGGAADAKGYNWFFRGREAYALNNGALVSGYPKFIDDRVFPNNPQAAVYINGTFYILKGHLAYKFDTNTLKVIDIPQYVSQLFPGLDEWTEATFKFGDKIFFFKDKIISIFDQLSGKLEKKMSKIEWPGICDS